jgi:LysM repeat protein
MVKAGLLLTAAVLAGAAFLSACGGSDSPSAAPDPKKIPTATLPAVLPEPLFLEDVPFTPAPSGNTYVIQAGDNMYEISQRLGISLDELLELNPSVDPTGLEVGQVIQLPGPPGQMPTPGRTPASNTPTPRARTPTPEPAVPTPSPVPPPTPQEGQTTYTVQPGDNANDIALRFGITVEELALANNTTVDDLRSLDAGDVLIIPVSSTPPPVEEIEPAPETPTPET